MNSDSDVSNDNHTTPASNHPPTDHLDATPEENTAEIDRPSAIERQIAAIQSAGDRPLLLEQAPPQNPIIAFFENGFDGRRWGGRALFAVSLIAAGLVGAYAFRADDTQNIAAAKPAVAQIANPLQKSPATDTTEAAPVANGQPVARTATPIHEPAALVESENSIIVPISDISLRVRPELLQQLVAVSRLRLTGEPNNAHATATLAKLRERALAELDAISATENPMIAADSLELAAKLFPELAEDSRYRSIAARTDTSEKNIAQSPTPATPAPVTAIAQTAAPIAAATPAVATSTSTQPPSPPASASPAQNPPTTVASRKPQVRVISLTPGIINKKDRFVPKNGGNIFRLNIGYRYRDEQLDNQPGSGLVAQLSKSGSSKVLAEVPVEVSGSKGERSFLIGTFEKADMTAFYKLNFVVDGNVLPSHTVQLMPADFAGL